MCNNCDRNIFKGKNIGETNYDSGPDGVFPSIKLADVLKRLNIEIFRFKTGTPARINRKSVDFSKMEIQEGDINPEAFSLEDKIDKDTKQLPCYLTYTNEKTHEVIRKNLYRSPLYSGKIDATGPNIYRTYWRKYRRNVCARNELITSGRRANRDV